MYDSDATSRRSAAAAAAGGLELEPYPLGGIDEVLKRLAVLVMAGTSSRRIRELALRLTGSVTPVEATGLPDRTHFSEIAGVVYHYVAQNVAYVHDPHGVESIEGALYTLEAGAGDCDAHTVLGMSLLQSLGIETRFVLVGQDPTYPEAFTHIYFDFKNERGEWVPFDTTLATYAGDAVPDAFVYGARVVTLSEAADDRTLQSIKDIAGPVLLQTHRAAPLRAEGERDRTGLAGPRAREGLSSSSPSLAAPAALRVATVGPIAGPEVWIQITAKSHEGHLPDDENFFLDLYVERLYEWFGTCDVKIIMRHAESGEELAISTGQLSKWTGVTTCEGEARVTFPLGFDPASTPVTIEVYDTGIFGNTFLAESPALYLATQQAEERTGWGEDLLDAGAGFAWIEPAIWIFGGGLLLFAAQPYLQPILSRVDDA